jgi:UDP-sugar transporter A1/2/3
MAVSSSKIFETANGFLPPMKTSRDRIQIGKLIFPGHFRDQRPPSKKEPPTRLYSAAAMPAISWWYLSLLALQFGCQPSLTKAYTPSNINRSTVVLAQDVVRFSVSCIFLCLGGSWSLATYQWTLLSAVVGAGIPAALYLVQNYCTIMAYQNLPPVSFNVLNQSKTLSAALCCYLVMGKVQSKLQVVSLFLLLTSALVLEKIVPLNPWKGGAKQDNGNSNARDEAGIDAKKHFTMGVVPVLLASFISGLGKSWPDAYFVLFLVILHLRVLTPLICSSLAGALAQKNLQTWGRNSYLFTMELSAFSIFFMLSSLLLGSPDGKRLREGSLREGWTWKTWIPIVTNASGGIVVGLVTKHAGAVKKGFALIFGLLLSGILQNYFRGEEGGVTSEQVAGGALAGISLWMHSRFPP